MNKRNLISSLFVFLAPIVLLGQSVVGVVTDEYPMYEAVKS